MCVCYLLNWIGIGLQTYFLPPSNFFILTLTPTLTFALVHIPTTNSVSPSLLHLGFVASLGSSHSMVLKQDGSVWGTGCNKYGQLGEGLTTDTRSFVQIIPSDAIAVATGNYYSMVLKQDGSVWATGRNTYGQLAKCILATWDQDINRGDPPENLKKVC